jgi:hypothetical protein
MPALDKKTLSYGVLIRGEKMNGSGFYLRKNHKLFLVTAKHVLFDSSEMLLSDKIYVKSYNFFRKAESYFSLDLSKLEILKKGYTDVALVHFADIPENDDADDFSINMLEGYNAEGEMGNLMVAPVSIIEPLKNVSISNDVYILGYPQSLGAEGSNQIEKDRPLIRKGIVAGINNSNSTIILDCPTYFGNSGGIVFELDEINAIQYRYKIIGVATEYIPFHEHLYSKELNYVNTNLENSGFSVAVPMDTILELIENYYK